MQMIPHEQFSKLRLRDFVPASRSIIEADGWEWMGSVWHNEGIGFTSFSRHANRPAETGGMEIYFSELPADCIDRLLSTIGLPLLPGMGTSDVMAVLGQPEATHQFVPDRRTYDCTAKTSHPYVVGCTIVDSEGLIHLSIIRSDLRHRE